MALRAAAALGLALGVLVQHAAGITSATATSGSDGSSAAPAGATATAPSSVSGRFLGFFGVGTDGGTAATALQTRGGARSFVRTLQFVHRLRVCNAYPHGDALDVYHGKAKLTERSMPYKTCLEFAPPVKAGDKLQFKIGGVSAGTFAVSDLPNNDAVLVLVIYRHDPLSSAVAFESHVFSNLINAQIAVLDTYSGSMKASARIQDVTNAKTSRSEELRYDSVVAVNPGIYEVVLQGQDGSTKARQELVALNRESYVVVRCGVEAQEGQRYAEELMVYPHSDARALMGGAVGGRAALRAAAAALATALACAVTLAGQERRY